MTRGLRSAALAALLGAGVFIAGCGLTPIYAERTGVTENMSQVRVIAGEGRSAYLLRQALLDELGAREGEATAEYELAATIRENRLGFGLRIDNVRTRYEVQMIVSYVLSRVSDGSVVTRGRVRGAASYDIPDSPYADIAVEERVRERAARQAADEIRVELSLFFADGGAT